MTLGENWAETTQETSDEPALTAEEEEAIRTAVYDKFSEALWVLTTGGRGAHLYRRGFAQERHGRELPALLRRDCGLFRCDRNAAGCRPDMGAAGGRR